MLLLLGALQVPGAQIDHLPEPAVQLWQKVLPLGLIFFCASFNLTILQVGGAGHGRSSLGFRVRD